MTESVKPIIGKSLFRYCENICLSIIISAHSQNEQAKLGNQLQKLDSELKKERENFDGKLRDVSFCLNMYKIERTRIIDMLIIIISTVCVICVHMTFQLKKLFPPQNTNLSEGFIRKKLEILNLPSIK